jgi:hypothetical protein
VRTRRILVGVLMASAVACSTGTGDFTDPVGPPPSPLEASTTLATAPQAPVTADVADLVATTTMTDRGRRTFLATSPTIEDPPTFATNCGFDKPAEAPGAARVHTAGCYVAGRIHLLAPDRAEAHDLLYVVAAHELLHAVYANLAPAERARIDSELEAARAGNVRLEERLKAYDAGPTLVNEIHSILGSEFDGLSPTLEAHYAQFFTNREAVLAARQRTLGVLEDRMEVLRAEMDDVRVRMDAMEAAPSGIRTFNQVRLYNDLVERYNAAVDALNALVDEYNARLGGG